ncbi:MAG: GatB/YqeY domain-containing protein [bacterium]|nr:GatB/YqeY domain-containing protein [bacterium]
MSSTGAKSMAEMGKVIGMVKGKAPSADGGKIAEMVKNRLGSG